MTEKIDTVRLIAQAEDLLSEVIERQFVLECLRETINDIYFDAGSETQKRLTNLSTLLRLYDNEFVTDSLSRATTLMDDVRNVLRGGN